MQYLLRHLPRLIAGFASVIVCLQLGTAPAAAEKRVALVIGNSAYLNTRALPNPKNDAEAIAKLLGASGFAEVTLKLDLDYRAMRGAVRRFTDAALAADVALVYYAGHGLEVAGENYLVPVDAKLLRDVDLEYEAVTLASVLGAVDGARKLKLVILDACRNNPLGEKMALRAGRMRSATRGLARLEATGEVLVADAAKAGTLAHDGKGRHSPYAEALLKHMPTPGLDVLRMFGRVKEAVLEATNRGQEPWIYGSPGGEAFALVPAKAGAADAKPAVVPPPQPPSDAERAWAAAKDSASIPVLEAFRRRHPSSPEAEYAAARIEELRKADDKKKQDEKKTAVLAPPPPPVVAPPKVVEPAVGAFSPSRATVPLTAAEERALKRGDTFKECNECPEMVVVPAGSFLMGSGPSEIAALDKEYDFYRHDSEGPQRRVTIARPFAASKFEVTFAEWDACVAAGGCTHQPGDKGFGRGKRPVFNVSWNDITKQYLPWLSRRTGKTYRLLSEAEWEYAARAGTMTRYAFGDTRITWRQAEFRHFTGPKEVGSFQPNAFGLYDMHGNVWEWCEDSWHADYKGAPPDGSVWAGGEVSLRVLRGGSWHDDNPDSLRSAFRGNARVDASGSLVGFRLARTL